MNNSLLCCLADQRLMVAVSGSKPFSKTTSIAPQMEKKSIERAEPNRTIVRAYAMMTSMSARLDFSPRVKMQAWQLYKKSELLLSQHGYQNLGPTVAVCLYLAGLCAGKPRTLKDILSVQFRNPGGKNLTVETGAIVEFLVQSFDMEIMGTRYDKSADEMRRYCVLLGMGKGGYDAARKALRKAAAAYRAIGRRISSDMMEAVAMYMAAQNLGEHNVKKPLLDVSIITGEREEAISDAYQNICQFLAERI